MSEMPRFWWSPTIGLIRGATNGGYEDAVPLVPAHSIPENEERLRQEFRDGWAAGQAYAVAVGLAEPPAETQ